MPADLNDYFNKNNNRQNNSGGNNGKNRKNFNFDNFNLGNFNGFGKFSALIYSLIIIVLLLVFAKPFAIVNSGEVGIKSNLGKYEEDPLLPGFHFFIPGFQKIMVVDTRVRIMNYTSNEDRGEIVTQATHGGIIRKNPIKVKDARNLDVDIDITIQYKLNQKNTASTIAQWGFSWENKIIDPYVKDIARTVVGRYTAEELPIKRNEIADEIDREMRKAIESQPNQPVELIAVQLREIILPERIKDQIERVQIAKQEAERTKYEVERANQEALKKAALAEGTAKAIKIEAQGRADAVKIEADAAAYANTEIAKSLDNNILSLKQIETQAKFNEALKENKDAKIFLTPGGAVPNIWVDTKDKAKQSAITTPTEQ